MSLISELRRRNVLRVAAAYLVLAWLLLQVGDVLFDTLELPIAWNKGLLALLDRPLLEPRWLDGLRDTLGILETALIEAFSATFDVTFEPGELTPAEAARERELEPSFRLRVED